MTAIDTAGAAPVAAGAYREAMARLASAVHLITTDGPGGRAGFTASAVCSVTDAPPTLLVCLNRGSSAHPAFSANASLCVNTLSAESRAIADAFGGSVPMAERFAGTDWLDGVAGAPVLARALVAFRCRIASRVPVGSHDILLCEVEGLTLSAEADALVYADRRYHTLPRAQPASRGAGTADRALDTRPTMSPPASTGARPAA